MQLLIVGDSNQSRHLVIFKYYYLGIRLSPKVYAATSFHIQSCVGLLKTQQVALRSLKINECVTIQTIPM